MLYNCNILQIEKLKDEAEKKSSNTNSIERAAEDEDEKSKSVKKRDEYEVKPALSLEGSEYGGCSMISDEGSSENTNYFGMEEETELLKLVQPVVVDSSLTSGEGWDDLRPDGLFDQAVDSCQWWDFWS